MDGRKDRRKEETNERAINKRKRERMIERRKRENKGWEECEKIEGRMKHARKEKRVAKGWIEEGLE
jgi:hypothetical protein